MTTHPTGPSTETARDVADMIAARGYPGVAEQLRDVAEEIDDDHVHPRTDGLWTTDPIPAALAGHVTGARPTGPKTATTGAERAESSNPHTVTYTATIDAKSVARAVAGAIGDLLDFDEQFGHNVLRRLTSDAVREDDAPSPVDMFTASDRGVKPDTAQAMKMFTAPNMFMAPSVTVNKITTDEATRRVLAYLKKRGDRGTATVMPDPPTGQLRPVIGEFYRLRDDVDRLGVPTDAERVRVLHITRDESSVLVDWPDLPPGPAHQQAMIPATHLVVTP